MICEFMLAVKSGKVVKLQLAGGQSLPRNCATSLPSLINRSNFIWMCWVEIGTLEVAKTTKTGHAQPLHLRLKCLSSLFSVVLLSIGGSQLCSPWLGSGSVKSAAS